MADENDNQAPRAYEFGDYQLIPGQRRLLGPDGEPVTLRGKVCDLLLYLVEHRGQLIEKSTLMEALWPDVVVDENNLNQAMTALRQALGDQAKGPRFIATVTGRGYQFIGDVRVVEETAAPVAAGKASNRPLVLGSIALIAVLAVTFWLGRNEPAPAVSNAALDRFQQISPRLVTDFHGSHSEPTLSPDGSMMAWVSDIDGLPQLWVGNLQVGDPIQITHDEQAASSPSWSPDNSQIIYERTGPGRSSIFSVDTLGTSQPRMLIEVGATPSFSRQTNQFVFTRGRQVWMASGDGSDERRIENLPVEQGFAKRMPALSPDGSLIAFVHAAAGPIGNLWVIGTEEGAEPRQLTFYDLEEFDHVLSPTFSADGKEIIFSVNENNGTAALWRVSVDGGEPQMLTAGSGTFNSPDVSATGNRVAYTDRRLTSRLVVIDPESGERKTIYESRHAVVLPMGSPNGSQIVFFSPLPNGMQILTIDSDGRSLQQRTFNDDGANTLPIFGWEENSIFYYEGHSLVRQYLDEGRTETVLDDFHWSTKNWPAVYEERIVYQQLDRTVPSQKTVLESLRDGTTRDLPVKLEGMTWSRDGNELLGFVRRGYVITTCEAQTLRCEPVTHAGEPVNGYLARWSNDETRIFFLRLTDSGDCCDLWVMNRDGSEQRRITHLNDFEMDRNFIGVTDRDEVFYNYTDSSSDEIWLIAAE
ncbi:MAG: winged helix-turn-helix domain-containing protein [Woeseiaceae bacterium]|nr:winged helix-turn-helix domain-containing protein [Woeseiaceae bacterium]